MKINFERDEEETLFFNMVAIFKQFGEIKELQHINPPLSTIDFIIGKLSDIIVDYKFFETNFSTENLKQKIMFLLGTGNFKVEYLNDIAKTVFPEIEPGFYFEIKKKELWNYLKENGLQF